MEKNSVILVSFHVVSFDEMVNPLFENSNIKWEPYKLDDLSDQVILVEGLLCLHSPYDSSINEILAIVKHLLVYVFCLFFGLFSLHSINRNPLKAGFESFIDLIYVVGANRSLDHLLLR